jgi:hypothetical protein
LLLELARQLRNVKRLAERRLYQCREFYRTYSLILQTVSAELQRAGLLNISNPFVIVIIAPGAGAALQRVILEVHVEAVAKGFTSFLTVSTTIKLPAF